MNLANKARGECVIIIENKSYNLCLTLGGLAELETAFAANDLGDLGYKLKTLSARDFLIVLMILLKGGANPLDMEFLKSAKIDTKAASKAISQAFALAFDD